MTITESNGSEWVEARVRELADARNRGESTDPHTILEAHPNLPDETAIRLIYEDTCALRDAGEPVATVEILRTFPRYRAQLRVLLDCDRLLRSTASRLPESGERLGPFELIAELGRGSTGITFLASEPGLADRLVVVKVMAEDQDEHLSLARLQHTHIIPLFSEQSFPERSVRALCMPYLGGTSLDRLLRHLAHIPVVNRRGAELLDALDAIGTALPRPPRTDGPCRRFLRNASWTQAVCWIAACLADALDDAHSHDLIHMDLKPSNVLVAADGLPMLLDFHLARGRIRAGEIVFDRLGGTPGWMAPEQEDALRNARCAEPLDQDVDHRADIYTLGLLMRDAMGSSGERKVDPSLIALIRRCTAERPGDRYSTAADLAADLRRHLEDRPLVGVRNRSVVERWRKWRRRRPGGLLRSAALFAAFGSILFALLFLGFSVQERSDEIARSLERGRQLRLDGRYDDAIAAMTRGQTLAKSVPWGIPASAQLNAELHRARRDSKIARIHQLAELVRFRDSSEIRPSGFAESLVRGFPQVWSDRLDLLNDDGPTRQSVRADLLDLAVVWAEVAPRSDLCAATEALRVLDETCMEIGRNPELDRLRVDLRKRLHISEPDDLASHSPAATAEDHAGLGRFHLRAGRLEQAREEFGRVLAERPDDFWASFYEGACAYRLQQPADAVAAFRACLALQPESAECLYNYALALDSLGRVEPARQAYDRAARLDPSLISARLNRGLSLYLAGQHSEAIRDFREASRHTSDRELLGRIHDAWALAELAEGHLDEARSHASIATGFGCSKSSNAIAAIKRRQAGSLRPKSPRSASASLR
jgi:Flp pilus assembly protein TadD